MAQTPSRGVINIIVRDQNDGGNLSASYGQTYAGDGDNLVVSGSYGKKLFDRGNLTISAEYRDKKHTNRAGLSGCLQFETGGQDPCAEGNIAIDPRETSFNRESFRVGGVRFRTKNSDPEYDPSPKGRGRILHSWHLFRSP